MEDANKTTTEISEHPLEESHGYRLRVIDSKTLDNVLSELQPVLEEGADRDTMKQQINENVATFERMEQEKAVLRERCEELDVSSLDIIDYMGND
jgi:uncharacterized protein YheU (UPF0270 family)